MNIIIDPLSKLLKKRKKRRIGDGEAGYVICSAAN